MSSSSAKPFREPPAGGANRWVVDWAIGQVALTEAVVGVVADADAGVWQMREWMVGQIVGSASLLRATGQRRKNVRTSNRVGRKVSPSRTYSFRIHQNAVGLPRISHLAGPDS